jgi:hypothetical protein
MEKGTMCEEMSQKIKSVNSDCMAKLSSEHGTQIKKKKKKFVFLQRQW